MEVTEFWGLTLKGFCIPEYVSPSLNMYSYFQKTDYMMYQGHLQWAFSLYHNNYCTVVQFQVQQKSNKAY